MKKCILFIASIVVCVLIMVSSYGQGCSDAGFCTINSFKPNGDEALKNQIKVGTFFGKADYDIEVYGAYLEYNRQINKKIGLDAKLTSLAQNGNGITSFGLSDIFANANYKATDRVKVTLGAKIPLSNANKMKNNLPLPMDYQSGLGTFDLLFGVAYKIKEFQFVTAIQQPLTQNKNEFLSNNYPSSSVLGTIQSTNNFKRSGDVLLRVSYPFNLSSKLKLTPSILPIYHLANDKYTNALKMESEIIGSKGLTLNANAYLDYKIHNKGVLQINVGIPLLVRDARPDGLTRSFIANLEYRINF